MMGKEGGGGRDDGEEKDGSGGGDDGEEWRWGRG